MTNEQYVMKDGNILDLYPTLHLIYPLQECSSPYLFPCVHDSSKMNQDGRCGPITLYSVVDVEQPSPGGFIVQTLKDKQVDFSPLQRPPRVD